MSEKKGNTVKLKYDFPSQRCCEVYIPNLEDWYRVTPKVFRSWCGQRRILHLEEDPRKNIATKAEPSIKIIMDLLTYMIQIKK